MYIVWIKKTPQTHTFSLGWVFNFDAFIAPTKLRRYYRVLKNVLSFDAKFQYLRS